jgi:hypothetical protein
MDFPKEQLAIFAHNPVSGGSGFSATYGDLKTQSGVGHAARRPAL